MRLSFTGATWEPFLGAVTPSGADRTGVILAASGIPAEAIWRIPALPERCPHCELQTGRQELRQFFRGIVRSPIRAHTAGLAQATQLLLSQLHRSMGETAGDSRTIVFTDSRDDAARTAVGVERNHFRDLVRQLIRKQLEAPRLDRVAIVRRGAEDETTLYEAERSAFDELSARDAALIRAYMRTVAQLRNRRGHCSHRSVRSGRGTGTRSKLLASSASSHFDRARRAGVNPAGPKASMARLVADQNLPWYRVHRPPTGGLWHTLPTELTVHDLDRQRESLATELASSIFDRAGRDVESIGLGWVDVSIELAGWPIAPTLASEVVRSIIRILGTSRRYAGGNSSTGMPDAVKKYLRAVAELQGVDPTDLSDAVESALDQPGVAPEWMLSTASADSKLELVVATSDDRWICSRCAASTPSPLGRDLHGNWLQSCAPRDPNGGPRGPGLLRWLASLPPRRLRVRELTARPSPSPFNVSANATSAARSCLRPRRTS